MYFSSGEPIVATGKVVQMTGRRNMPAAGLIQGGSEFLDQYQRLALPVVHVLAVLGQVIDAGLHEAALQEPVRGARRQHEQLLEAGGARAVLEVLQQALAIALCLRIGADGQASRFGHLLGRERVQRSTAEDHAVMFDDGEVVDLALDQLAARLRHHGDELVLLVPRAHALADRPSARVEEALVLDQWFATQASRPGADALAVADALIVVPEDVTSIAAGEKVTVLDLRMP